MTTYYRNGGGRGGFSNKRVGVVTDDVMRQWLSAIAGGNKQAFSALYQAFLPRLYGYLRLQIGHDSDVQDLLQDTFVTVWRSASRYSGQATVATWIFGIARHKLLDWLRAKQKLAGREQLLADGDETLELVQADFADTVASELDLATALDALPPHYAELVYLVFHEAMNYRDIASILEIPEGTVKSRMHQAKRLLRQQLWKGGMASERNMS